MNFEFDFLFNCEKLRVCGIIWEELNESVCNCSYKDLVMQWKAPHWNMWLMQKQMSLVWNDPLALLLRCTFWRMFIFLWLCNLALWACVCSLVLLQQYILTLMALVCIFSSAGTYLNILNMFYLASSSDGKHEFPLLNTVNGQRLLCVTAVTHTDWAVSDGVKVPV